MGTTDTTICSAKGPGWRCENEARARGLCMSHYRQAVRHSKKELQPIRVEPGVRIPTLTVSAAAARALEAKGPTPYLAARAVLEAWAKRQEVNAR